MDTIRGPLWDASQGTYASNKDFVQQYVANLLTTSFPNLRPTQVEVREGGQRGLWMVVACCWAWLCTDYCPCRRACSPRFWRRSGPCWRCTTVSPLQAHPPPFSTSHLTQLRRRRCWACWSSRSLRRSSSTSGISWSNQISLWTRTTPSCTRRRSLPRYVGIRSFVEWPAVLLTLARIPMHRNVPRLPPPCPRAEAGGTAEAGGHPGHAQPQCH